MPPLKKAVVVCFVLVAAMVLLLAGYVLLRRRLPSTDASLARVPDLIQMEWEKRARRKVNARERALEASRACVANGERYCLMENFPAALREYKKALELDGSSLHAALEVGRVAWHLHDREDAKAGWQKAITIDPLAAAAHAGLFEMLGDGNDDDRRRAFRHALTLMVLSPHRTATREYVTLHPELGREISLVAADVVEPPEEKDPRKLLSMAWQHLPKRETREADACFAKVLATQMVAGY